MKNLNKTKMERWINFKSILNNNNKIQRKKVEEKSAKMIIILNFEK